MSNILMRPELGEFSSIICFKALITGMEEALGEKTAAIALIAAGRKRGKNLVDQLGLTNAAMPLEELTPQLAKALGKDGTCLCQVEKIVRDGEAIEVYVSEALCSAGEIEGSARKCTFTLGAIWGALEQIMNIRLQGIHTESVLRGGKHDVFKFTPIS